MTPSVVSQRSHHEAQVANGKDSELTPHQKRALFRVVFCSSFLRPQHTPCFDIIEDGIGQVNWTATRGGIC